MNESMKNPDGSTKLGRYTVHMCVDIEGVLRRDDKRLSGMFTDDGKRRSGRVVRDWLKLQLAHGKKVLPFGEPCDGFSYETGCPGHPITEGSNQ